MRAVHVRQIRKIIEGSGGAMAVDGPFAPAILARAKEMADAYQIILWTEHGEFYGRGLELPHVMNDGRTADECVRKTREILTTTVAYLLESGQPLRRPPPRAGGRSR